jgi:hypothetical protein
MALYGDRDDFGGQVIMQEEADHIKSPSEQEEDKTVSKLGDLKQTSNQEEEDDDLNGWTK